MDTHTGIASKTSGSSSTLFAVLVLLIVSSWTCATASEVPFAAAHTIEDFFVGARSVHLVDLDGDGDQDIVGAAQGDGDVSWFENDSGDGSSWTENSIDNMFQNVTDVVPVDVNSDGLVDVVGAGLWAIFWWEQGSSTWMEHTVVTNPAFWFSSLRAGDLDRDGDLDLASVSIYGTPEINWWENDGTPEVGTWLSHGVEIFSPNDELNSLALVDMDADGDLDIVSAVTTGDTVSWWENDGTPANDSSWTEHSIATGFDGAFGVFTGDIDGDGDQDVVGAASVGNDVTWWENTAGTGLSWTPHSVEDSFSGASGVRLADLDKDGDLDIIGAADTGNTVAWWENDGTPGDDTGGDGNSWTEHTIDGAFNGAVGLAVGDVDGDGDMDVVGAARNMPQELPDVVWWENETIHRNALFPTEHVIDSGFNGATDVCMADFTGDGSPDVAGVASDGGLLSLWESDGTPGDDTGGDGNSWTEISVESGVTGPVSVIAADVDQDGDLDMVRTLNGGNDISWWENTAGDGSSWTKATVDASVSGAADVAIADLDRDGDPDIIGAASGAGSVSWWENDGTPAVGTWTEHGVDSTFSGAVAVYVADIDGDGDLDIIGAAAGANDVSWWENDGTPGNDSSWTEYAVDSSFSGASDVYVADMDLDGDLDIIGAASTGGLVSWWENDGSPAVGTWTEQPVGTSFAGAASVFVYDLDFDGDPDILASASTDGETAWYENTNGAGTAWSKRTVDGSFAGASGLVAGDVDLDGDLDVLGAAATDDTISWWENRGGQFALATTDTAPASIDEGTTDDVLEIEATHNGRSGDSDVELVTFELLFEETDSDPLTSAEANNLIANLFIYKDDGDGGWDAPGDTLVVTVATLSLTDGVQTVTFGDDDPDVRVFQGSPEAYFVVVELTGDANGQSPNMFQVSHITEASSTGEDRDNDIPLTLAYAANVTSTNVIAGDGADPQVSSATAQDSTTVRVAFNEDMADDADLVNEAFYTFTGGGVGLTASSVSRVNETTVDITVNEMTNGASYTVVVSTSGPTDLAGNTVDPGNNTDDFTGIGVKPQVLSATPQNSTTVRVVFNEAMANNADLVDASFYTFSGGGVALTASGVTRISATEVDVTVNEMTNGASYIVVVATASPTDLAGNTVDPGANSYLFTGVGVKPQVSSALALNSTTVRVMFSEAMADDVNLFNESFYTFTGGGIPITATSVSPVLGNSAVDVTVANMLEGVDYIVTVDTAGPTDLGGNHVDPANNSAVFIGVRTIYGETIYVDASNTDPSPDGSQGNPYPTIGAAVSQTVAGRRDVIRVYPGTYEEMVSLLRTTTLRSEDGAYHTLISGGGANQIVLALADGCVLRGFSVGDAGTEAAVSVPASETVTVTNCVLHTSGTGLHALAGAEVAFVNSTVDGNTTGVRGKTGATFNPLKNTIFTANTTAVLADSGAIVGGSYNDFYDNGTDFSGPSSSPTDIFQNPLYVDSADLNFHLKAGSPCRNAGDPATEFNDRDGSRNDIGADGGPDGVEDVSPPVVVATATPDSGLLPLNVAFDASGSSDEWGIDTYSWDWDDSNGIGEDATGATVNHVYGSVGAYVATLTVTDNSGISAPPKSLDITVSAPGNEVPTAAASVDPIAGPPPLILQLNGSGSDPDGGSVTYAWDLDNDGQADDSTAQNPTVNLPSDAQLGNYVFTLTVTDDESTSRKARAYFTATDGPVDHAELVQPGTDTTVEVTEGGSATLGTTVFLPNGAISDTVVLAVGPADSLPPVSPVPVGGFFHLGPTGLQFAVPVTVTVPHSSVPAHATTLAVLFYDWDTGAWKSNGISNVAHATVGATHTVSFDATHLTLFVVTTPLRTADINLDGKVDAVDIQLVINAALGFNISPYSGDTNGDGRVDAVDIQRAINSALGLLQ